MDLHAKLIEYVSSYPDGLELTALVDHVFPASRTAGARQRAQQRGTVRRAVEAMRQAGRVSVERNGEKTMVVLLEGRTSEKRHASDHHGNRQTS